MPVIVDKETGLVYINVLLNDSMLAAALENVPSERLEEDITRLMRNLISASAGSGGTQTPRVSRHAASAPARPVRRPTESARRHDASPPAPAPVPVAVSADDRGRLRTVNSDLVFDGIPERQYDDGELIECDTWFEGTSGEVQSQMRAILEHWARVKRPRARVDFDGVMMTVSGRGYDRRCDFCRTVRTVIKRTVGIDVLRSECPYEPDVGDLRPRPGEELIGLTVGLIEIESGQKVTRQIVRRGPDPAAGIITWESPIAKGLMKAGGLQAQEGAVIMVHGQPMYRLVEFTQEGR